MLRLFVPADAVVGSPVPRSLPLPVHAHLPPPPTTALVLHAASPHIYRPFPIPFPLHSPDNLSPPHLALILYATFFSYMASFPHSLISYPTHPFLFSLTHEDTQRYEAKGVQTVYTQQPKRGLFSRFPSH